MTDLPGNERHRMIEADVTIRRDPDTGEFIGVRHNGHDHSLEEWNRLFEEARPQLGSAPLERVPRQPPPINSPLEP